ncbi:MAG: hypothetical protein WCH31_08400 [Actinomycetes bacterium]
MNAAPTGRLLATLTAAAALHGAVGSSGCLTLTANGKAVKTLPKGRYRI